MNADVSRQNAVRAAARQLGFDLCEFVAVGEAPHADFFDSWIEAGRAGEMHYLERNQERRRFPALLAQPGDPPLRTLIVLGVDYHQFDLPPSWRDDPSRGLVAAYAWGDDYHELIRPQLYALDRWLRAQSGRQSLGRGLVDTGPVLERDWAAAAGVGFTGKNCCTIRPGSGSWLLLATLLVPELLVPELLVPEPLVPLVPEPLGSRPQPTCGRCTRCLAGCPTAAFSAPYDLDPRRCIAYWTIEARSIIPRELRSRFGNRIFGCDICQELCPYNRRLTPRATSLAGLQAHHHRIAPPLLEGFASSTPYWLEPDVFNRHFARSPVRRARQPGMLRNVCVALGNWGAPETLPALELALGSPDPVVRCHAAWAVGEVLRRQHPPAAELLHQTMAQETDSRVCEEVRVALADS
jgi:epoxyqueuosine reductase